MDFNCMESTNCFWFPFDFIIFDFHDDCTQCVGHFEAQHHHECDCQYCQFLSLGYFGQDGGQPSLFSTAVDVCHGGKTEGAEMLQAGTSRLRAPPVHYCYSFVA